MAALLALALCCLVLPTLGGSDLSSPPFSQLIVNNRRQGGKKWTQKPMHTDEPLLQSYPSHVGVAAVGAEKRLAEVKFEILL